MQLVIPVIGAVIGGVLGTFVFPGVGTATGAEIGFAVGGIIAGLVIHQKGPQPNDLRVQDSAYGKPIPVVYGMYRVAGNVIWAGQPVNESGGGKGNPPSQAKVSMSFAVGLCEGPITGVRRIWANGKLIFDISNPSNFQALSGSAQMTTGFVVYPGDENQMPDPIMEAALGTGNVPPYRGLAYVVFNGLDLSPWGNYMPSLSFEVVQNGALAWSAVQVATITDANTPFLSVPYLTAQGGEAVGYESGAGYIGNISWILNAYGTAPNTTNQTPLGISTWPRSTDTPFGSFVIQGNADEPGFVAVSGTIGKLGWYQDDGGFTWSGISLSVLNNISTLKQGLTLFATSNNGNQSIYRSTLIPESIGNPAGIITAASTVMKPFLILGASASYLYAIDVTTNIVYQFGINSLTLINTFTPTATISATTGYVVDDRHVWGCGGGCLWYLDAVAGVFTIIVNGAIGTPLGPATYSPSSMRVISPEFIVTAYGTNGAATIWFITQAFTGQSTNTTLAAIVSDICARAGMSSGQYDVTQLTDAVQGYAITNHSSTRANIAPLMATYFFDACDIDNQIRFVRRGASPVGSFAWADLGASSGIGDAVNENPITEVIAQEVDLPRTISFSYNGLNSDYLVNTQRAFRSGTRSNQDVTMAAPIVLPDDEGLMRAQTMLWSAWVGRKTFQISTRVGYLLYEPGDVMTLYGATGQTYTVRIVRCAYDGQGALQWDLILEEPDIYPNPSYRAQGGAPAGFTPQQVDYSGPTILAVMDVPPLRDSDTSQGLYLAACGFSASWPGAMVEISRDGNSYTDYAGITNQSGIGYTATALPAFGGGNQPDELSTVSVVLYTGTLSNVSYADFLAGVNAALIGGELLYFRNATLTGANTYRLSGFLRGRQGTEYAMATHGTPETFVFLDPAKVVSAPINLHDIGATLFFEPHLMNLFASQPVSPQSLVPANARVKPLSPVLFGAAHGSVASLSDISLSWIRRARVNTQWISGADVPLDESAEAYTLDVYGGSTLKRTVTVSAARAYTYAAADITADGFTTGNPISFSVSQNSDQGVLGYPATASIVR